MRGETLKCVFVYLPISILVLLEGLEVQISNRLQKPSHSRICLLEKLPVEWCIVTWVSVNNPTRNIQFSIFAFFDLF